MLLLTPVGFKFPHGSVLHSTIFLLIIISNIKFVKYVQKNKKWQSKLKSLILIIIALDIYFLYDCIHDKLPLPLNNFTAVLYSLSFLNFASFIFNMLYPHRIKELNLDSDSKQIYLLFKVYIKKQRE